MTLIDSNRKPMIHLDANNFSDIVEGLDILKNLTTPYEFREAANKMGLTIDDLLVFIDSICSQSSDRAGWLIRGSNELLGDEQIKYNCINQVANEEGYVLDKTGVYVKRESYS